MWAVFYLDDADISVKSKGLMAIMERKGQAMTIEEFLPTSKDGYTSVQGGLHELIRNGYYYSKPIRGPQGKFIKFEQNVRFTVKKPVLEVEKNIVRCLLLLRQLDEIDIDTLKTSAVYLATVEQNYKEMLIEANECLKMGYPNASIVLKVLKEYI